MFATEMTKNWFTGFNFDFLKLKNIIRFQQLL